MPLRKAAPTSLRFGIALGCGGGGSPVSALDPAPHLLVEQGTLAVPGVAERTQGTTVLDSRTGAEHPDFHDGTIVAAYGRLSPTGTQAGQLAFGLAFRGDGTAVEDTADRVARALPEHLAR